MLARFLVGFEALSKGVGVQAQVRHGDGGCES